MSGDANRIDLIVRACREIEARLKAHRVKCDDFALEVIGMKCDWCFYSGLDFETVVDRVSAQYVPASRRAA
jgi:hypothetical protein